MKQTRVLRLALLLLALLFAVAGRAQDACEMQYTSCMADCRAPGPPSPGCAQNCKNLEMECVFGGSCSPFCPP